MDEERMDEAYVPGLIEEYLESGRKCTHPIVLQWQDTGEYEIVPEPYLTDISWSDRMRPRRIVGTLEDLMDYYGFGMQNIVDEPEV